MKAKLTKILVIVLSVSMILVGAVGIYASDYYRADTVAIAAAAQARQDGTYTVFEGGEVGVIFYPGGKVEDRAYAPLMEALAQEGITCIIAEMPLNLAVLKANAWKGAKKAAPHVTKWFIGGHSLGGAMAAGAPADQFAGLILLAAYPTKEVTLPTLSVIASEDKVLNWEKYKEGLPLLPKNFTEVTIEGGNHGGFGSYGPQAGDGEASLSPEEQTRLTAQAILNFIKEN